MPAYISHAIMGEELYREADSFGNILKVPIRIEELRGYSLGADLAVLSKKVVKDPHDFYTRDFFIGLVKYIKDNNLIENGSIMALLYGHMAHYYLDINTHPLIYYIECGCEKAGFLSNHDLVEGYLSSYLVRRILDKDIMDIKASYFNQMCLDKEICNLLNNVYGKIYHDYEIVKSYKKVIGLFSLLENFIKSGFVSKEVLINFSRFREFLEKNNLTVDEILNSSNGIFRNPVTGEVCNDSFIDSYYRSIEMSLTAMKEVNKCLYDGYSIDNLLQVFTDLSYDTGVDCSLGKEFIYVRKLERGIKKGLIQ